MPDVHPAHSGLPALYRAEASAYRGRWTLSVYGPDRDVAAGPADLGPADAVTTARPGDLGRHLIAVSGEVPVLPRAEAERALGEHGFVIEAATRADAATDQGWSQISAESWTAPCQPMADRTV